jgi:hypothetical protein
MKYFSRNSFVIVFSLIVVFIFVSQLLNGRLGMADFQVYHSASKAFIAGDQVYGKAFGLSSGFFKYSPFSLLVFAPLAMLPFAAAKVIYFFILGGASLFCFLFLGKMVSRIFFGRLSFASQLVPFLALAITGSHLFRELSLGNVNMLLLFVFSWSFHLLLKDKQIPAGIWIAVGILIKPHFLLLLPLLLFRKKFKTLLAFGITLLAGLLLPLIFKGFSGTLLLSRQWIQAMQAHNADMMDYPNTIYALLYKFPIRYLWPGAGREFVLALLVLIALLFLALLMGHLKREKTESGPDEKEALESGNFAFEYFFIIALIPNITATDTEHFLFSLPLILFVFAYFLEFRFKAAAAGLLIISFFSYSSHGTDILGKPLADWSEQNGLCGLGNLIILFCSLVLFRKRTTELIEKHHPGDGSQTMA